MAFGMKDFVNQAINEAKTATKGAMEGMKTNPLQGILGNYSEVSENEIISNYGVYLMEDETVAMGFKLVRDVLIFTDKRIILIDKQGVSGKKTLVKSINLFSIIDVWIETSGFGFDDCELTFKYISTPNLKAFQIEYEIHKLEFPKNYPIQNLYKLFQELAYENCLKLNG